MIEPSSLHSQVVAHLLDRCYDRPLIPNLFRGEYVEAMVLHLLGVDDWMQTDPWASYDLVRRGDGARGEVKQSAVLQSWHKDVPASKGGPTFSIAPRPTGRRVADFYIFALHDIEDPEVADHRQASQWQFFVVSEAALTAQVGRQKTIGLKALAELAESVDDGQLAATVARVVPLWSL